MQDSNGGATTGNDEMHVLVIDEDGAWTNSPGDVLEAHGYVSKASDAKKIDGSSNYVRNVLLDESVYIYLGQQSTLTVGADINENIRSLVGSLKTGTTFQTFDSAT